MLRIKRSVEASYSTVNYNAAEMSGTDFKAETLSNEDAMKMIAEREGVKLNPNTSTISGFVAGGSSGKRSAQAASLDDMEERVAKLRKATAMAEQNKDDDDEEIDIDELVDELEGDADDVHDEHTESEATNTPSITDNNTDNQVDKIQGISTKVVPAAVFGGLVKDS
jgi:hypothetical protein